MVDFEEIIEVCGGREAVAEACGIHPVQVWKWARAGELPGRAIAERAEGYRKRISKLAKKNGVKLDPRDIP